MQSLDPRIQRLDLQPVATTADLANTVSQHQHWETYEVFVQPKSGSQPIHEGSLHAASSDMALVLAKEQFGRRGNCYNIWIVKTSDIYALNTDDSDMFDSISDKKYRNPGGFKVSDKITQYKREQQQPDPPPPVG